jgi:hypothetical protein
MECYIMFFANQICRQRRGGSGPVASLPLFTVVCLVCLFCAPSGVSAAYAASVATLCTRGTGGNRGIWKAAHGA